MPTRIKTKYPGVYYREANRIGGKGAEKVYYVVYKKDGKVKEEKVGRQFTDDMTPARAAGIRAELVEGKRLPRKKLKAIEEARKKAEAHKWTIDRLWKEYKAQRTESKGLRVDANRYENHLQARYGNMEPKDLIQLEVNRLRINLLKKKSPQTVKHVLALLKRIINFGTDSGLCSGPSFKIKLPKVHNEKTEDLTPGQLDNLLRAIENDDNIHASNMMKMALYTGMRRGEMFKLKWKDINFERGFITLVDPKGGPDQKIPLNDAARKLLENHPKTRSPYIFPGRGGRQRTDINHQVSRIRNAAGLPKGFRPLHSLRHVYASMLASSGKVDMYTLQKLLTHKSPIMTQRYAHLRDEALRRASDLAGSIIDEAVATADNKTNLKKVVNLEDHKE